MLLGVGPVAAHPVGKPLERQRFATGRLVEGRRLLSRLGRKFTADQFPDGVHQLVLDRGIVPPGLFVVDLRKVRLVAALAEDAAGGDVARHVVGPRVEPEARPVELTLEPHGVVNHHLSGEKDHRQVGVEFPNRDRVVDLGGNLPGGIEPGQHRLGQLMVKPAGLELLLPVRPRLGLGQR